MSCSTEVLVRGLGTGLEVTHHKCHDSVTGLGVSLPDFQRMETLVQLHTADHSIYKKKKKEHSY